MSDKFDAIIVGAGVAGSVAGYLMAKEGLEVLIIERGNYAGSKNMTGGRLYSHSLEKIMPGFAKEAPVERKVTREKISMLTEESAITIDFYSDKLGEQGKNSYTVLRGEFDQWLAEKAEEAGAQLIPGVRVDDLILQDGKVCGVRAGEDELEAEVVILADGVNSLLAQKLGFRGELKPYEVAVGVKEVIELPQEVIEDRFNLKDGEGLAWLFVGSPSAGRIGGGFLYTNKASISIGVVCSLQEIERSSKTVPQMLENFKNHPIIEPLIKGGTMVEYSGHLVPEGGYHMIPKLVGDGVLVIGDAAGFCINIGYTVRGMDLAIASAEAAAKAVLEAKAKGDYSEASLAKYKTLIEDSFIMKDLNLYRKFPQFMENPRIFNEYPRMISDIMTDMFIIDGSPSKPLKSKILRHVKTVGLMNVVKDGFKGVRSI
ncbi:FAD-dependent oxidoreductase [Symbiobacterium thermophilum]|uniref:FAD-dependent oxidoreductase n=1 Tax=Symbiobacterium thermophilum TaxID=2734 RepID=A0A953I338_SYMTR|nr:FAD-dependent oxidoreductase [Symbiobacterium thermophilum]MBY6276042.1 FAD-dependent oxidoreductase [Symbiobacterium thermophilum]